MITPIEEIKPYVGDAAKSVVKISGFWYLIPNTLLEYIKELEKTPQ